MDDSAAIEPPGGEATPAGDFNLGAVGPWLIGRKLGGGGQGNVHLVRHSETGLLGAAKLVRFSHGQMSGLQVRFEREVAALRKLDHPNIVRILDSSPLYAEEPWMVMEFVGGELLATLAPKRQEPPKDAPPAKALPPWEREPLPARRIALIVGRIARAMGAAHGQNILHRDLKCENVVMRPDGEPVIVDFGLALHPKDEIATMTGFALGTPVACAPEVLRGLENSTQLSDIFSIGVMLYRLLTGQYPWGASNNATAQQDLIKARKGVPFPMRTYAGKADPELEAICMKCLDVKPDQRFSSCVALAEDLERWLAGLPTLTRPPSPAGRLWKWARRNPFPAALVAIGVLSAGGYAMHLVQENARLLRSAAEAAQARQREAQRLVWEAFSARQRRDKEGMDRAQDRFREIVRETEGWKTVEGVMDGLLRQQAIAVPGITSLAGDAGGRKAAGLSDGRIRIFDAAGNLQQEFLPPAGAKGKVSSLAFASTGHLFRAAECGGIHILHPDRPAEPARWLAASAHTLIAAGPHVIACGPESGAGDVFVLDAVTGRTLRVLPGAGCMAAAGSGRLLTATAQGVITVWDAGGNTPLHRFAAGGPVGALSLCGNDRWAAWAEAGREAVHLKDLHHEDLPPRILAGADSPVTVLSGAGEELAAGCTSGSVVIWNPGSGSKPRQSAVSHVREVSHIVWPGAATPVTAGADGVIRMHPDTAATEDGVKVFWAAAAPVAWTVEAGHAWRMVRGALPVRLALPDAGSRVCAGVSGDGTQLCTIRSSGQDSFIEWLSIRDASLQAGLSLPLNIPADPEALWGLQGGVHLARLSSSGVRVLDAQTGAERWAQTFSSVQDEGPQTNLLLSADGSALAWYWKGNQTWMTSKSSSPREVAEIASLAPRPGHSSQFIAGTIRGECGILDAAGGTWAAGPVKVSDGPLRAVSVAADGNTIAFSGHLDREGRGGGLTLLDARQIGYAGLPSFVLSGQRISGLAFSSGGDLGFVTGDGTISFAGPAVASGDSEIVPVRPEPARGAFTSMEWVTSPSAQPLMPSDSVEVRQEWHLRLDEREEKQGVWAHTFAGLPGHLRSARLILSFRLPPGGTKAEGHARLGSRIIQGRWMSQATLPLRLAGQGNAQITLDVEPQLIAGAQGSLECLITADAVLTGLRLVIEPEGEAALPEGARRNGVDVIFDSPVAQAAALTDLPSCQRLVLALQDGALWSAGGAAGASAGPDFSLPAGAEECTCTFDLEDPAGRYLALWLRFAARGLHAELNGVRIPRPDAAPMAGMLHFIDSGVPGLLRRGKNVLRITFDPVRQLLPVQISGGIVESLATAH